MAPLIFLRVHFLNSEKNEEEPVLAALADYGTLTTGLRIEADGVELIVTTCVPDAGQYVRGKTECIAADQVLPVFQKVHVLPYKDTFRYNFDFMYHEHIVPYFNKKQAGEFTVGNDFAYDGVRFRVEGVLPENTMGVVGKDTTIFFEGDPIERQVLERLQVCPYKEGLPEKYMPNPLSLDEPALLRDYLRPYFEQRSAIVGPGETLEIQGVRFKVIALKPGGGGGVGKETELACQGVALRENFGGASAKAKAKSKASAKAGAAGSSASSAAQSKGGGKGSDGKNQNCTVS